MSGLRYEIGAYEFRPEEFLPRSLFDRVTEVRVTAPEVIAEEAAARRRRPRLTVDGRLTILAADHPARMVLGVGDNPTAMGNRWHLLARILRVISAEGFDGVMATPDIVEELLILNRLDQDRGGPGFLDGKVILGCMNRGGLAGAVFELDDRMTGFTAERIAALGLDGAKMMFRLDPADPASLATIEYCVRAINECHNRRIPVFLEALYVERVDGKPKQAKTADALVRVVSVATGLGASTALTWLKIPYCEDYARVAQATTCPILMLGGESRGDPTGILQEFAAGMRAGAAVRGALVGRNVTFPGKDDPRAVALAVSGIVHRGLSAEEALALLVAARGQEMDRFTRQAAAARP
jgi:DhnA family fructose-bisphosphate aldolase class Ia